MYTSGKLNKPKLVIPKFHKDDVETKFNDGFIKTRMPVVKAKCYDHEDFTRPYGQKCVCDDQGCRLGNAPLCYGENYNGYGFDYYWQPGAKVNLNLLQFRHFKFRTLSKIPATVQLLSDLTIQLSTMTQQPMSASKTVSHGGTLKVKRALLSVATGTVTPMFLELSGQSMGMTKTLPDVIQLRIRLATG